MSIYRQETYEHLEIQRRCRKIVKQRIRKRTGQQQSQGIQDKGKITDEWERAFTADNHKKPALHCHLLSQILFWEKLQHHKSYFNEIMEKNWRMSNMEIIVKKIQISLS